MVYVRSGNPEFVFAVMWDMLVSLRDVNKRHLVRSAFDPTGLAPNRQSRSSTGPAARGGFRVFELADRLGQQARQPWPYDRAGGDKAIEHSSGFGCENTEPRGVGLKTWFKNLDPGV